MVDGAETDWGACLARNPNVCSVLTPLAACGENEACAIVDQQGTTECLRAGQSPIGGSCQLQSDCVPGSACAGLGAPTCARICALDPMASPNCSLSEGDCTPQIYSPAGTGLCVPAGI
ncbi:MAG: hypothetical protein ACPGUV_07715 [Polyangiales bacterium]